ncbi:MAG: hypothetical protein K0R28_346 [Paenibacillus sp.]|nr:hypothetical protein [Paenibacillus sp.]
MLWLNLCLLLLFLRLVPVVVNLREGYCPERLPVVMVCAVERLRFRCVHSPEPARSCCRRRKTGENRERQGKPSELLPKAVVHLLRTKGCAAPVCGGAEAKRAMPFNNNLSRLPDCGWFRGSCNCFLQLLVCKLLTEKPKESRNSLPTGNLSRPSNPRSTRFPRSYSSPVATGFSLYEIQSLQLPPYSFTLVKPASVKASTFGQAVTPEPQ